MSDPFQPSQCFDESFVELQDLPLPEPGTVYVAGEMAAPVAAAPLQTPDEDKETGDVIAHKNVVSKEARIMEARVFSLSMEAATQRQKVNTLSAELAALVHDKTALQADLAEAERHRTAVVDESDKYSDLLFEVQNQATIAKKELDETLAQVSQQRAYASWLEGQNKAREAELKSKAARATARARKPELRAAFNAAEEAYNATRIRYVDAKRARDVAFKALAEAMKDSEDSDSDEAPSKKRRT